ncbi:Magnesium-like protein [Mycena indigotica]|uniref:Magnesium-like protein n=1 Tax=Mycena indigotica TaxID=2126181 RepID=A0A8H6T8S8_9AGAR|nr:Magnesium-like protein [Mycena indigotica]KAF7312057.1 Magnesium-like protein [Mycena indigotica]
MPRENSFSDSDGRSLTPDLDDEEHGPSSPTYGTSPIAASPTKHTALPRPRPSFNSSRPAHSEPIRRFRHVVRKVIAMHRSTTVITTRGIGAEPGVDVRRASADAMYGGIKQDCIIEVADYSSTQSSFGRMTNREFVNFMNDDAASAQEPWVKVRWINIAGMSWDVIKAVSLKYNLHPLALEDVFNTRSQTRSKVDYYTQHLFLRILCHELSTDDEAFASAAAQGSTLTDAPRSESPVPFTDADNDVEMREMGDGDFGEDEKTLHGNSTRRKKAPILPTSRSDVSTPRKSRRTTTMHSLDPATKRRIDEVALRALKSGDRVNVKVSPMFIFLFRSGVVISMHSAPSLDLTQPITRRLRQRDTGLRTSADPSLLVQSLLDLLVDKALEVIDTYHVKIRKFEREILLKPKIETVRNLHILSGDLILHKRTLEPIRTVIYGLRRYDVDRAAALVDSSVAANQDFKPAGFMSHKSKIYLADVFDHMEYILSSLEMFAGIGENLINYTFNMASYEMNEVMRRLTLATIIFLPLTLLTGYFGMNFEGMWSVHGHSDLLQVFDIIHERHTHFYSSFWEIALPVMAVVLPIFITPDIKRIIHYVQKHILMKRIVKKTLKTA